MGLFLEQNPNRHLANLWSCLIPCGMREAGWEALRPYRLLGLTTALGFPWGVRFLLSDGFSKAGSGVCLSLLSPFPFPFFLFSTFHSSLLLPLSPFSILGSGPQVANMAATDPALKS